MFFKNYRFYIYFLLSFILSCASYMMVGNKTTKYGSTIETIEWAAEANVEYESKRALIEELEEKAHLQLWSSNKLFDEREKLPDGGYLIVNVNSITIDGANTIFWEFLIRTLDDVDLYRIEGKDKIPNFTSSQYGTTWWNLAIIPIEQELDAPFLLYVFDTITNKRSCFKIYPNKQL